MLRALKKVPVYQNQLWAMEQLVQRKEEARTRSAQREVEKAQRLERERMEKLKREEEELEKKKSQSKPLKPMNKKRASSSDEAEEEEKHAKKKVPKKKPQVAEKKDDVPAVRNPPRLYKPKNQQEWNRWNASGPTTEDEWRYSIEHGTEALECLIARGANHLIPHIEPGQRTPWIEPPDLVPIMIPVVTPPVVQAAATEALPPLPASPSSDSSVGEAMSSLNLR